MKGNFSNIIFWRALFLSVDSVAMVSLNRSITQEQLDKIPIWFLVPRCSKFAILELILPSKWLLAV